MSEIAYVNGEFVALVEARVSVEDRGYLFGDGVYEAVRTYGGRLWLWDRHQQRLRRSLGEIGIKGFDVDGLTPIVEEAVRRADNEESLVYYHVTRGTAPRCHHYSEELRPNVLVIVRAMPPAEPGQWDKGVSAITRADLRWGRCDIKSLNLLPNVLAKQQARVLGCHEAILYSGDGLVTEGSSTSVFCVINGVVQTHPEGPSILPGITRGVVLELASKAGIESRREAVQRDSLLEADEVFLTGTGDEVTPVVRIDGRAIGEGRPGPITRSLQQAYHGFIRDWLSQTG